MRDVLIRGNVFENCNYGPWGRATIDIDPGIPKERQDGQRFHRNIRIEGNRFLSFHRDLVKANCVDGLAFTGNHVDFNRDYPGSQQLGDIVVATHCSNITIADNAIID